MIAAVVMITTLFSAKTMRHLEQTGRSHFSIEEPKQEINALKYKQI
jgi:hypothetical protein